MGKRLQYGIRVLCGLGLVLASVACGDDEMSLPAAKPRAGGAPKAAPKKAAAPAPDEAQAEEERPEETYSYTSIGKRDPFISYYAEFEDDQGPEGDYEPQSPLELFDISQLRLVGIVTGISNPRALVQDPTGTGYIVTRDTLIGKHRGRVTSIQKEQVIITEEYRDVTGKRVSNRIPMKLPVEQSE